jgi:ribosomal protein S18 acetylase RimI-like enzyme
MRSSITLRPIAPDDEAFLYRVYAGTRMEELAVTGWDEAQKELFLRMQFNAQHRYYQQTFPGASFQVIAWEDQPAGRLYVDRRADEISIIDIALLPDYRGRGIGSVLLTEVMAEASAARKPVRIYVERFNRALRWYERLGFRTIGDTGVYFHMEWMPGGETASQSAVGPS